MAETVRLVEEADVRSWVECTGVGFLFPMHEDFPEYYRGDLDLSRTWGSFDRDRVVGTLRSIGTEFTVPGPGTVPVAALTSVTVAPTHRRRGLLTQMISADLRASAERQEPLGILIASEYPIYGRFGYGAAIYSARYSLDLTGIRFRSPAPGTVELVDRATLRKEGPDIYERFRVAQPGSIERPPRWWDRTLHQVEVPGEEPPKGYQALYRAPDGRPEGYVRYRGEQKTEDMRPAGELTVDELLATTPAAYQRLWQFCCDVDLVTSATAADRPVDEVLPWLVSDGRAVRQAGRFDFVWVRVLDVAAALSGRRYAVEGSLVLEIVDDALGFTGGRYRLEGGPDGATCARTDQRADVSLPVDALGSVYAGGVPWATLAAAGRVDAHSPAALERAGVMFRTAAAPWCNTWF